MTVGSIGGTYGLSGSGMDIDSIVKKLMAGQQAKDDALVQKKTVLQWQKAAYNTLSDDISNFRTTVFNYKLQATLSPNKVSSSNTSVATVSANAEAADVNHSLVVAQLAGGVNLTSAAVISATSPPALGTLAAQIYNNIGVPAAPFQITITNGTAVSQPITIDPANNTINDVVSAINKAGVNVKASYDSTLDRFFLSTTNTGAASGISFAGSDPAGLSFIGKHLKLPAVTTADGGVTYSNNPVNGQDAIIQLDGVGLTEASNSFSITGVTYNLAGISAGTQPGDGVGAQGFSGQATTVSVTNDLDTAVSSIKSLVDSYNKILAEINGKVNETRYTDYPPLTDAQKAAMKDSDITLWNTKAQSGMLHNDSTLTSLVNTMRNALSNPVTGIIGTYNSAASIGITTGDYTEGGKLYLNMDKLRTALQTNPNVLNQLFGASGTTTTNGITTTDIKSQGIAGRLYDGIKTTMDKLTQIAGATMNAQFDTKSNFAKKIIVYNKQIHDAADKFNTIQSAYYKQFNAMELALQKLSAQSSWLSAQLGSNNGG
ncbi:MAG: flagellar filament capping protein FliD [Desulfitobacteriaceae bacterium]